MSDYEERSTLNFQDAVRKHFAFVEEQYGCRCVETDLYTVKYASEKVYINIYHEKASYELYFEIGLLPEEYCNPLKVDTKDIVLLYCMPDESTFYQASNKEAVNRVVEKLSYLARIYAKDAFNASSQYFKDVAEFRKQKQSDNLRIYENKVAEHKAQNAWDDKDYRTVVKVYTQFENQLSPVQLKRLEYAKRKLLHE